MKMNQDCMRDILLSLEKLLTISVKDDGLAVFSRVQIETLYEELFRYSREDILYSVLLMSDADLLDIDSSNVMGGMLRCDVLRMTYAGHEFLNRVRDPERWKGIKKILSAVRNFSMDAIRAAADGMTSAALNHFLSTEQASSLLP